MTKKIFGIKIKEEVGIGEIASLIVSTIALIIAIWAFLVSREVAYGESDLELTYALGNKEYFYWHTNDSFGYEFMIHNKGYDSTVYVLEPLTCPSPFNCMSENATPIVKVKYNDEEEYKTIYHPDLKSIQPKSSHFIVVIMDNITETDMTDYVVVLVRDLRTNEHLRLVFERAPVKYNRTSGFFYVYD